MKHRNARYEATRRSAARLLARLVARDHKLDWREIEFVEASGALTVLGVTREEFLADVARCLHDAAGRRSGAYPFPELQADLGAVRERPLQLALALLLALSPTSIGMLTHPSALVKRSLEHWRMDPEAVAHM